MPFRKKYYKRRKYRRRGYRRRRYGKRSSYKRGGKITSLRAKNVYLADTAWIKFKYSVQKRISPGLTGATSMSGNDLFDPDPDVGGAQCTGYDQWSAFYSRYLVYGASVKCTWIPDGTNNAIHEIYLAPWTVNATTGDLEEQPYGLNRACAGQSGSGRIYTFKKYMSTSKIFGHKIMPFTSFGAATGSSPGFEWYWVFHLISTDGTSTIAGWVTWDVTYYTRMYVRNQLSES